MSKKPKKFGFSFVSLYFCKQMINEATQRFILQHREENVRRLAFGSRDVEVDLPMALQQIAGWQTARKKLPSWAAVDDIVYPPHLNMEQCSSEQTARYKAKLAIGYWPLSVGPTFVDLTGGFGIDFYFIAKSQKLKANSQNIYVERNSELCETARHNFLKLGLEAEVVNVDAEEYLKEMSHADVVYLDPARRDEHGGRTYGIEDCTPNVRTLLPLLLEKSDTIILKLSPMLDWQKAVNDLGHVQEVHVVSVDNECKELLLVVRKQPSKSITLVCVNNDSEFRIVRSLRTPSSLPTDSESAPYGLGVCSNRTDQGKYLYEPNASIMKAGCFREIEETYGVSQLSSNSHLFVSEEEVRDFPGRQFRIETITSLNKQELRNAMKGIDRANISVRNFPLSVEILRKRLKVKDGGAVFIFGTTLSDSSHKLFICRKIG